MASDTVWRETPVVFTACGNTPEIGAQYGFIVGVRAKGDLAALPREIQYQIAAIEPNAVLQDTEILSDRLWKMLAYPRFRALLLVVFGAGALLLAAVAGCGAAIEDGSKVTWTRQPYQMFHRSCFDAPKTSAEWDEWERSVREMHGIPQG